MSDPRNDSGRALLLVVAAALVCVVGHGIGPAGGQSTQPASAPAEEAELPKISTVLGAERAADADTLVLRNGDKLTGTIGNPSFTIRTAYATVQLATSKLAGIDLEADAFGLEAFLTVNASRFSGFVTDEAISFKLQTGPQIQVRREKILKVVFRLRDGERRGLPQRQFLVLNNGDHFSGLLGSDTVTAVTSYARFPVKIADADQMSFSGEKTIQTTIRLRNGDLVQGVLDTEDIEVDLDIGVRLKLYCGLIRTIYCRPGFVPDEYKGAFSGSKTMSLRLSDAAKMAFVLIPRGQFMMGSPPQESGRDDDEGPRHSVTIAEPFYLAVTEVTQAQYESVMGSNPSEYREANLPVGNVGHEEAVEFCRRLGQKTGRSCRLPTEAEWEYACRGGSTTAYFFGDSDEALDEYAWYEDNSRSRPQPVATRKPNPWGLHDMPGNMWEWCAGWLEAYPGGELETSSRRRIIRGGSYRQDEDCCRSAYRGYMGPSERDSNVGLRVVVEIR